MKFDLQKHHRRSTRLKGYDYSNAGAYFVTVVAWQREILFGDVVDGEAPQGSYVVLNELGQTVADKWQWLETQYSYVELGAWIVMPNHFHGILVIHENGRGGSRSAHEWGSVLVDDAHPTTQGDSRIAPTLPTKRKPLGGLIGAFKTVSTKHINLLRGTEGQVVWQHNYGACPEPVEGNTSSAPNGKWIALPGTLNPIRPDGRRMTKTPTACQNKTGV